MQNNMQKEIIDYIENQHVGVLAVEMLDGSPHAATVHFASKNNPLIFFFETCKDYRKNEPLSGKETTRASFVIGFDETNMKTLQLDGIARLIKTDEQEEFDLVYYGKFPHKKGKFYGSPAVFFRFEPTWWRFTDWTRPEGKLIITSP